MTIMVLLNIAVTEQMSCITVIDTYKHILKLLGCRLIKETR